MPRTCSSSSSYTGQQTEQSRPRHVECVRVIAAHHPLAGQLVPVVRRKRHQGEPHLVIERPDGGRQLLAARCVESAGTIPLATGAPLVFTPGSLRLLASLVATLRSTPSPAPEARDAPRHQLTAAAPAPVEHLPARDPPAAGRALDRPAAAADPDQPGADTRAVGAVP